MRFFSSFVACCAVLALTACSSTGSNSGSTSAGTSPDKKWEEYGRLVTGEELVKTFKGRKAKGKNLYKTFGMAFAWTSDYKENGNLSSSSGGYSDTGSWSIENDKLCLHYKNFREGKKYCDSVRVKDNVYTSHNDYRLEDTFTFID